MKKIIIIALLASLLLLTGCSGDRVRISRNSVTVENIVLPLRHGYQFAEDVYTVQDTDQGYDIIIHAIREDQP